MLMVNHQWLQSWINAEMPSSEQIEDFLLRQGFETEPIAPVFTRDIVVGEILEVKKHPDADKLNICQVQVNDHTVLEIICGCPTVKAGIKVAAALDGAALGDFKIEKRKIRGVTSNGMLCSMQELGFKVASGGIWHLDPQAPVGQPLDQWLQRSSKVYGIELTPNRGDCLSVRGMSREFAIGLDACANEPWEVESSPKFMDLPLQSTVSIDKEVRPFVDRFHLVRLERDDAGDRETPDWMKVRLLEAGFSLHHCVVDILNYAMLETGQPFHAYTGEMQQDFGLRFGKGESVALLNGEEAIVDDKTLVIDNGNEVVCIAGYMGMQSSSSASTDQSIYLEAAAFESSKIAYHCRSYPWHTQSGSRFERGIDFANTAQAMQRAIDLLGMFAGYKPKYRLLGEGDARQDTKIHLPESLVGDILGYTCQSDDIEKALVKVGCHVERHSGYFDVQVPSWRNDLRISESLVSEYLRIFGMREREHKGIKAIITDGVKDFSKKDLCIDRSKEFMVGQGFYETYSYSFGDTEEMLLFHEHEDTLVKVRDPISASLETMRPTIFTGLLRQLKKNLSKQITDIRLFEVGQCFELGQDGAVVEQCMLSAVMTGRVLPESWKDQGVLSFAHAKSMLQRLMSLIVHKHSQKVQWRPDAIPGMHPHQSGKLVDGDSSIGYCGLLHPEIAKKQKIQEDVFIFSISVDWLAKYAGGKTYRAVSNQPAMRRDLSLIVPESVCYAEIKKEIQTLMFQYLTKIVIFDIYRGSQIPNDCYSISLGLMFQSEEKTLTDLELAPLVKSLMSSLVSKFNIKTRGGNE